jgi:DNA-binding MarR family transcriptional regulator
MYRFRIEVTDLHERRDRRRMRARTARTRSDGPIATDAARHVAAFRGALRSFLRTSEQVARASGLTPQRYLLLLMIKGAPDGSERATVSDLAQRMELAQSTVTELVQRSEDAGLIERERSAADARVAHLLLTAEGERRLARAFRAIDEERQHLREMLAGLDARPAGAGADG